MIKVYIGPMFSGKSGAMISEYKKIYDKSKVICFKSDLDSRDGAFIKSKQFPRLKIPAITISKFEDIQNHLENHHKIIFIDEANFIKGDSSELLNLSLYKKMIIHVSGLALTAEQKPFGQVPYILAMADHIYKYKSECQECSQEANWTYYDGEKNKDILVGDENYMALCDECLRTKSNSDKK